MAYPHTFASSFSQAIDRGLNFPSLRASIDEGLDALFAHPRFRSDGRLLFTGSGDSLFAAVSALPALRRWSGVQATAMPSMEFARYEVPLLQPEDIVFGVSNSGSASRTRETVALARARGNLTVGVTGSVDGPLAKLTDAVVFRPVGVGDQIDETFRRVLLNMVEYLAALYTIYRLGIRLGVARGTLRGDQAVDLLEEVEQSILSLPAIADRQEGLAETLAQSLRRADTMWVIGAGPNWGTARYAAAKCHEQLPINGIPEDLEEWAHLQYFLTLTWAGRSTVWVLAPPGNCLDRAEELVEGIALAGGRPLVVAHPGQGAFPNAHAKFDMPLVNELLTPLTYHLPVQLLVLHLARLADLAVTPLRRQDDYRLIRGGIVRTTASGLN